MATCPTCRKRYPDSVTTCEVDGDGLLPNEAFSGADVDLAEGLTVGEYRIEKKIGEGGFGSVYKAVHPLIGKAAAVKVLNRQYSSNPQMVSRFISEARAVNQIRHRNIIDIFSFGTLEDGRQYFVMELLEGMPLDAYLKERGRLAPEDALPILRSLARALDAAHAAGIAHRDLKPENVFLSFDDEGQIFPKLLDFGIAKLLSSDGQSGGSAGGSKTRTGTPMGTPYYMSPEQCRGKNVDKRTDIYSFGVMTHELLTGRLPFDGDDLMELLIKQTTAAPPPMSSVCALPAGLDAPVLRMLEKDPEQRPSSLTAAVDELTRAAKAGGFPVVLPMPAPGRSTPSNVDKMNSAEIARLVEARTIQGPTTAPSAGASLSQPSVVAASSVSGSGVSNSGISGGFGAPMQTFAGGVAAGSTRPPKRSFVFVGGGAIALILGVAIVVGVTRKPSGMSDSGNGIRAGNDGSTLPVAPSAPTASAGLVAVPSSLATTVVVPIPAEVEVKILTTPPNATVWLGTVKLGVTPGPVRVKRGTEVVTLTVKADGYASMNVDVTPSESSTISNIKLARAGGSLRPVTKTTGAAGEIESPDFK